MNLARKILAVLAAASGVTLVVGLILPGRISIRECVTINAPGSTVFTLLNDFHRVDDWWTRRFADDPNARISITGPARGEGAEMRWQSDVLGDGRETITASEPYLNISTRLQMDDLPHSEVEYAFIDDEGRTTVEWRYDQKLGFDLGARYYGLLLDDIVRQQYLAGLRQLAVRAESLPPFDFSDLEIEYLVVESTDIAYVPSSSEPLARAVAETLGEAYFRVLEFIETNGLSAAGSRISISRDFRNAKLHFEAGVPVRGVKSTTPVEKNRVRVGKSYGGPAIRVRHEGPFLTLSETHEKIAAYLAANGLQRNGDAWEAYVSDRATASAGDLVTYVYYPIAGREASVRDR